MATARENDKEKENERAKEHDDAKDDAKDNDKDNAGDKEMILPMTTTRICSYLFKLLSSLFLSPLLASHFSLL